MTFAVDILSPQRMNPNATLAYSSITLRPKCQLHAQTTSNVIIQQEDCNEMQ